MPRTPTPFDYMTLWVAYGHMMAEAQVVIGMRVLGMAGMWPVTASENAKMFGEKAPAFARATTAATRAALLGKRPDEIARAALAPVSRQTRSNAKRLSRLTVKRGR